MLMSRVLIIVFNSMLIGSFQAERESSPRSRRSIVHTRSLDDAYLSGTKGHDGSQGGVNKSRKANNFDNSQRKLMNLLLLEAGNPTGTRLPSISGRGSSFRQRLVVS